MLEKYLADNDGGWNGNSAFVFIGEYRWKVAYKEAGETKLTGDGLRLCPNVLDYTTTSKVELPKKREKKPALPVADDLDLDDI